MQTRILTREQLEGVARVNSLRAKLGLSLDDIEAALRRPPEKKVLSDEQRRGLIHVRALMRLWSVPVAEVAAVLGESVESVEQGDLSKKGGSKKLSKVEPIAGVVKASQDPQPLKTTQVVAAPVGVVLPAPRPVEAMAVVKVAPTTALASKVVPETAASPTAARQPAKESAIHAVPKAQPATQPVVVKRPGAIVTTALPLPPRPDHAPGSRLGSAAQRMSSPYSRDSQRKKAMPGDPDYVKYRHPVTGQTWSGKGKQPAWIAQALGFDGLTEEQLRADSEASVTAPKDSIRVLP